MDYENLKKLLKNIDSNHTFTKFLKTDDLTFAEPGVGNVNFVLRVSSKADPKKTVIVKHACPFTKCLGPDYPLDVYRNTIERKGLRKISDICPGQVPEIFHWDKKEAFMIMQDLKHYEDMNDLLVRGYIKAGAILKVILAVATLHRKTHRQVLTTEEFTELERRFRNETMCELVYNHMFTSPFIKDHPALQPSDACRGYQSLLYGDDEVISNNHELRDKYKTKKECLLHGDLHPGAVMVNGEDFKLIDAELICTGPPSFDLAMLISHLQYFYHVHRIYPRAEAPDFATTLQDVISTAVELYVGEVSRWLSDQDCEILIQETTGFIGCEMCKRTFSGAAFHERDNYPLAEQACIRQGVKLIKKYKEIKQVEDLNKILRMH